MSISVCFRYQGSGTNENSSSPNLTAPWLLNIGGTPYSIQFTNFEERLDSFNVVDLISEAQYDIMKEMAATYPSQDRSIGQRRAWTSDTVNLAISSSNNRIVHSVCGLYLAAMVRLWGFEHGFYEADLEFLKTEGAASLPEVLGRGRLAGVGGTVEI